MVCPTFDATGTKYFRRVSDALEKQLFAVVVGKLRLCSWLTMAATTKQLRVISRMGRKR